MSNRRILTIGECMVEMAPREDGAYHRNFAGDTFNTAWYLRRLLGADDVVDYCSAIGVDAISQAMFSFMQAAGIGTGHLRRLEDATVGLYMIELANGERSFSYWRGQSAAKRLADDRQCLLEAVRGRDLILFSGITLAILSPMGRQQLLEVLAQARDAGSLIAFDPNMRARLWPDRDSMCNAVSQAAKVADIVLPSFDEDGPNFNDATPEATIIRYRKAGAATVVVKNGAGRVHAFDATEGPMTFDPVPLADLVDTTAAGDSFNAGFLSARLSGVEMAEALAQGAAISAQVIRKRGALVKIENIP
ncbi:sugar kinase [Agrobacterium vitis]|uniref:Sugar kinase n=1 Tax=Agrobacterium vitis TaxID=373 RepID=A0A6L6VHA4_AGRVI|nr:sugar kinase [Agrobacterium vitis]MUZ74391.1 sugar kinase [Agrobacterium vitis]